LEFYFTKLRAGGTCYLPDFMPATNVVVISKPGLAHLSVLKELPPSAHIILGNTFEELSPLMADAEVILNGNFSAQPFRSLFPLATKLRWVHSLSAGVESVLSPQMVASKVPLTNARGVFKESLAEFGIAAMLFFAKDLRRMLRNQAAARWEQFDVDMLEGATLGVVGYGEIGRATAKLAHAFGMKIIALRRRTSLSEKDPILDATYSPAQLGDLMAASDYVLIAAPNTPETEGMVNAAAIARMKPTAVILNVGRGPVIEERALLEALESKRIRGAGLDVFETEPLPSDSPFYRLENVLLSPHCADHTAGWVEKAMHKFVENYKLFEAGEPLTNLVDKSAGY
jgi:phosphoglycerate dehydrogenase-like enzyme